MPQSTGSLPCPIRRRSAMIFSTRGCSLKLGGIAVSFSASICRSASVSLVSSFSFHFVLRYFDQSTANGGLKLDRLVLLGWKAPPIPWRNGGDSRAAPRAAAPGGPPRRGEPFGVELAGAGVRIDDLVHQRLRHHRLVLLVVAELAE